MIDAYAIAIAALLFAAAGWLAYGYERRAHRVTRRELARLTDRDERGRFVKRGA